jgi:plastocyanin
MTRVQRPSAPARRTPRRRAALVLTLAAALGVLVACGGSDDDGGGDDAAQTTTSSAPAPTSETATGSPSDTGGSTEAESVTVTSVDFSFELDEDSFPAGTYEFTLVNGGGSTHDLRIERDGEDVGGTEMINPGEQSSVTIDLEPGEYVFYCSVGNHRAMGMEMTVTVT